MKIASQTMNLSIFTMLQNLLSLSGWFLFFVIIEKTGDKNLATSNIIRSYYILWLTPVWAYSASVSTLISNAIGAEQQHHVYGIIRRVALFGLITAIVAFVPTLISAKGIMSLYTNDMNLINMGFKALYIVGISNIMSSVIWIIFSAISATGNTMIALFVETSAIVCYLFSIYFFASNFPQRLEIIWCSEIVYQVFLCLFSILYLRTGHWKNKKF